MKTPMGRDMSEFRFEISQRVILPKDFVGAEGVQGIVYSRTAQIGREPFYFCKWPLSDKVDQFGDFTYGGASLSESELIVAQPAGNKGELSVEVKVDQTDLDAALGKARELEGIVRRTSKPRKLSRKRTRK